MLLDTPQGLLHLLQKEMEFQVRLLRRGAALQGRLQRVTQGLRVQGVLSGGALQGLLLLGDVVDRGQGQGIGVVPGKHITCS